MLEKTASVGVAGPYADYPELSHIAVGAFRMAPVAAPTHVLAIPGELPVKRATTFSWSYTTDRR